MENISKLITEAEIRDADTGQLYEVECGWIDSDGKLRLTIITKEEEHKIRTTGDNY